MKDKHRYGNLLFAMLFTAMLCIALFTCMGTYFFSKSANMAETKNSTCTTLSVSNNLLFQKIASISNIGIELSENYELKQILKSYNDAPVVEQFYTDKYIDDLFVKYLNSFIEISSIKAYIEGKKLSTSSILSADFIRETDWYKALQTSSYTINIEPKVSDTSTSHSFQISLASSIESGGEKLGYIQIVIAQDFLVDTYLATIKTSSSSSCYIVDNFGNIVVSNIGADEISADGLTDIFSDISTHTGRGYSMLTVSGRAYHVCFSDTNGYGLKTVEIIPDNSIYSLQVLKRNAIIIFLVMTLLSAVIAFILLKLVQKASKAEQYQFEYLILREKINPHFLYNILDAISWSIYGNSPKTSKSLSDVALLYRKALKIDAFTVVSDEIEYVKTYLNLTKDHLNPNIDFSITANDDVMSLLMPGFILQPIIENSIKHGFINKSGKCIIDIKIEQTENTLKITVYDNGNGIAPEQIRNIFSGGNKHVGISNIQKRINMLCGKGYGISFKSEVMQNTTVTVTLPILRNYPKSERKDITNV